MDQRELDKSTWDQLTPEERYQIITKEKTMRQGGFATLVKKMSEAKWDDMSSLQQDAAAALLELARN